MFLFHTFLCVTYGVSQYAAFENPTHAAPLLTMSLRLCGIHQNHDGRCRQKTETTAPNRCSIRNVTCSTNSPTADRRSLRTPESTAEHRFVESLHPELQPTFFVGKSSGRTCTTDRRQSPLLSRTSSWIRRRLAGVNAHEIGLSKSTPPLFTPALSQMLCFEQSLLSAAARAT